MLHNCIMESSFPQMGVGGTRFVGVTAYWAGMQSTILALCLTQSGTRSGASLRSWRGGASGEQGGAAQGGDGGQLARARLAGGGGACAGRGCDSGASSAASPDRSMYLNCSMCCMTSRICTSACPFSPAAAVLHLPELRSTCT